MLRLDQKRIALLEQKYPGIQEQILRFEAFQLPPCPECGSLETARILPGVIGRTISIAAATANRTSRIRL
jgi:hypothetical protein